MFALSFGVFRINFTSILDGFLRIETHPNFIFVSFKNSLLIPNLWVLQKFWTWIQKEHTIVILTLCSKTFTDPHNRSKNERIFCPETFQPPVRCLILFVFIYGCQGEKRNFACRLFTLKFMSFLPTMFTREKIRILFLLPFSS